LNEKVGYRFCQVILLFLLYDKKWFHTQNMKHRSDYQYFYQKLSRPLEKRQMTPRLKTPVLKLLKTAKESK